MTHVLYRLGLLSCLIFLSGCNVIGAAAAAMPLPDVKPAYTGLAGQSVAVMVWVDAAAKADFPALPLDTTAAVQNQLDAASQAGKGKKYKELKDASFPHKAASLVRFQRDHPEIANQDVTQFAPRLGVSRLVYIEITDFGTRAPASVELFRGTATGSIKVIEINGDSAKVAFSEDNIRVTFPPKLTEDGTPNGDDLIFYNGTKNAFALAAANRLMTHPAEDH